MPDIFKHEKGPDFVGRLSGQITNNSVGGDQAVKADDLAKILKGYAKHSSPKPLSIGLFRTDNTTRKDFAKLLQRNYINEAHINIQGPNKVDAGDDMFAIRRAIMLRYLIGKHNLKLSKDSPALNALLHVLRLRHGARSLEAILAMSDAPEGDFCNHKPPVDN